MELLSTTLHCLSPLASNLPALAVRITDSRILDAILDVCLWVLPASSGSTLGGIDLGGTTTSNVDYDNSSNPNLSLEGGKPHLSGKQHHHPHSSHPPSNAPYYVNREKLLHALSAATDCDGLAFQSFDGRRFIHPLLTALNIPDVILVKRLNPFFRVLSQQFLKHANINYGNNPLSHQNSGVSGGTVGSGDLGNEGLSSENSWYYGSPLSTLDALEKVCSVGG